jgi:cytochrome d ubiquinol oxidase subunit I
MGLALIIVIMKTWAARQNDSRYDAAARFWIRIFGITFAIGVVTGIPMEFQFGTNWSRFSARTGGVIGQSLGMEGMFAFFLESSFLSILVWGEKRFGPKMHRFAAWALFIGSWLSGYFIIVTNAFMQHPVGYRIASDGTFQLQGIGVYLFNSWAFLQYLHNMLGAVVTGSFVVAAVGAFYQLRKIHLEQAQLFLRVGVLVGLIASCLVAFPTGDLEGKLVAQHQPVTLAAMEGRWQSGPYAELTIIGYPNPNNRKIDYQVAVPGLLSFMATGDFASNVKGLDEFPEQDWPNIRVLFSSFRVMVGLGTFFIGLMGICAWLLYRKSLSSCSPVLRCLVFSTPLPFIANTAGWMTAEFGRQPWLIYGLFRTNEGHSALVHSSHTIVTSVVFALLYVVLSFLYVLLVKHVIVEGPNHQSAEAD